MENILKADEHFFSPLAGAARWLNNLLWFFKAGYEHLNADAINERTISITEKMFSAAIPVLETLNTHPSNPAILQAQLTFVWMMGEMHNTLSHILDSCKNTPLIKDKYFQKLGSYCNKLEKYREYEQILAVASSFALENSKLKHKIGELTLSWPLHIAVDDIEDGKHISCLEIPQVYGCGKTESEAMEMLDREIQGMYLDLSDGSSLSPEFETLKIFLETIIFNAQRKV